MVVQLNFKSQLAQWHSVTVFLGGHLKHHGKFCITCINVNVHSLDAELTRTNVICVAPAMSFAKFQFVDGELKSEPSLHEASPPKNNILHTTKATVSVKICKICLIASVGLSIYAILDK